VGRASRRILRFLQRRGVITLVTAPGDGEVTVVPDETLAEQDPLLAQLLAAATIGAATKLDAVDTTTIQNNRFEIAAPMFGSDLDDQASNYMQTNNLLIGGGLKVQWNRYNTYVNNILINGAVIDVHQPWANSNHTVKNNLVVGDVVYSFYGIGDLSTDIKARIPTLDYNLFYNGGKDNTLDLGSTCFAGSGAQAPAQLLFTAMAGDPPRLLLATAQDQVVSVTTYQRQGCAPAP
jgi:hypothetical protein